mgnify:CR=1 FL=1
MFKTLGTKRQTMVIFNIIGKIRNNFPFLIILDYWTKFFKHEIAQKVLNLMSFNNYELTENYVLVYSQFKEIEKILKTEGLCKLS